MSDLCKTDWRAILCVDVQWDATPEVSHRVCWNIYRRCNKPHEGDRNSNNSWHEKTLGDLCDMGIRAWQHPAWGEKTYEAVKLTIDYAAAGNTVTRKRDVYVPRPWKNAP